MRISDWSSDVCSSDLGARNNLETILASVQELATGTAEPQAEGRKLVIERFELTNARAPLLVPQLGEKRAVRMPEIGRTSCRESVCQYVWISVVAVPLKKNKNTTN